MAMTVHATQTVKELDICCAQLEAAGLDAPWSRPGPLIPAKPTAPQVHLWRWREIEPLLRESSDLLSLHPGAERRVLRLRTLGVPERTATHSLMVALQCLLPDEVAPAHRHSPSTGRNP
jgi:gentisate 1,2-dioxygenase